MTQGRFVADVDNFSKVVELHPTMYAIAKICIMMHVYCQLLPEDAGLQTHLKEAPKKEAPSQPQDGIQRIEQVKVKKLNSTTITELSQETNTLDLFNEFPTTKIAHYLKIAQFTNTHDLQTARARLLIGTGKGMIKLGEALATHRKENDYPPDAVLSHEVSEARKKVIEKVMHDKFAKMEADYRAYHEKADTFHGDMPTALHPPEAKDKDKEKKAKDKKRRIPAKWWMLHTTTLSKYRGMAKSKLN